MERMEHLQARRTCGCGDRCPGWAMVDRLGAEILSPAWIGDVEPERYNELTSLIASHVSVPVIASREAREIRNISMMRLQRAERTLPTTPLFVL